MTPCPFQWPVLVARCGCLCAQLAAASEFHAGFATAPALPNSAKPRGKALFWHEPHYSNRGGAP